jgi:hypothetical protein
MAELWQRALLARRLGLTPEQSAALAQQHQQRVRDGNRKGGYAGRKHPKPKVGETYGRVRVVRCMGSGRNGRADLSFWVECLVCGAEGAVYEFNLRKGPQSVGCCWRSHKRTAEAT